MTSKKYLNGRLIWLVGFVLFIFFYNDLLSKIINFMWDIIPQFYTKSPLMFFIVLLFIIIGNLIMKDARTRQYWENFDAQYERLKRSAMKSIQEQMKKVSKN